MSNINKNEKQPGPMKHSVKDSVFRKLFSEPVHMHELFMCLDPDDKDVRIEDLRDVTIKNYMINDSYNDIAFMKGDKLLMLVEAQDTWSDNIIIRIFLYRTEILKREIVRDGAYLFGKERVNVARPVYVVLYTGNDKNVKDTYRLSDVYYEGISEDEDITVHVIRDGFEEGDIISQYVDFTERVDDIIKEKGERNIEREDLVSLIDSCVEDDILPGFLRERKAEVMSIMMSIFSEEYVKKCLKEEARREVYAKGEERGERRGVAQGKKIGIAQGEERERLRNAKGMRDAGVSLDVIENVTGLSRSYIQSLK